MLKIRQRRAMIVWFMKARLIDKSQGWHKNNE